MKRIIYILAGVSLFLLSCSKVKVTESYPPIEAGTFLYDLENRHETLFMPDAQPLDYVKVNNGYNDELFLLRDNQLIIANVYKPLKVSKIVNNNISMIPSMFSNFYYNSELSYIYVTQNYEVFIRKVADNSLIFQLSSPDYEYYWPRAYNSYLIYVEYNKNAGNCRLIKYDFFSKNVSCLDSGYNISSLSYQSSYYANRGEDYLLYQTLEKENNRWQVSLKFQKISTGLKKVLFTTITDDSLSLSADYGRSICYLSNGFLLFKIDSSVYKGKLNVPYDSDSLSFTCRKISQEPYLARYSNLTYYIIQYDEFFLAGTLYNVETGNREILQNPTDKTNLIAVFNSFYGSDRNPGLFYYKRIPSSDKKS